MWTRRARMARWALLLASGALAPGLLQSFGEINFAELIAAFLTQLLSALVTLWLGGTPAVTA